MLFFCFSHYTPTVPGVIIYDIVDSMDQLHVFVKILMLDICKNYNETMGKKIKAYILPYICKSN